MKTPNLELPKVVNRADRLSARLELLAKETELKSTPGRAERRTPQAADGQDREGLCLRGLQRVKICLSRQIDEGSSHS